MSSMNKETPLAALITDCWTMRNATDYFAKATAEIERLRELAADYEHMREQTSCPPEIAMLLHDFDERTNFHAFMTKETERLAGRSPELSMEERAAITDEQLAELSQTALKVLKLLLADNDAPLLARVVAAIEAS
jgi:hypothetical protein